MWKKLHLKDHSVVVLSPPAIFNEFLKEIKNTHKVSKSISAPLDFLLAFVTKQSELPDIVSDIRTCASNDPVVWFAYPKRTSKLAVDLSRDKGFSPIGKIGYEAVTGISIDEDWSALRFRKVEHIKKMVRLTVGTISDVGKKRTINNKGPPGWEERAAARKAATAGKTAIEKSPSKQKVPPHSDVIPTVASRKRSTTVETEVEAAGGKNKRRKV